MPLEKLMSRLYYVEIVPAIRENQPFPVQWAMTYCVSIYWPLAEKLPGWTAIFINDLMPSPLPYTGLSVSVTVTHWDFLWHSQIINTRGSCRLLRHRLPTSSQRFINRTSLEVDLDWSVVFRCTFARTREFVHALRAIPARGYPRVFLFIYNYFNGVFKSMN